MHVIWIRIGLSDATCFYLTLASATIFLRLDQKQLQQPQPQQYSSADADTRERAAVDLETAKYYALAISSLRRRMQDPLDRVSHAVIATVLGFICHDVSEVNPCYLFYNYRLGTIPTVPMLTLYVIC